ncbi:hypothetical protein SAMN04488074_11598 [Lentzea albidocapillata subsp. violacea]|uniref:Uncharacterized protein n=1 Tax=Lentzea albidocapillata subsp. violacea TaxID=128104 RepID=A0A1G9PNE9_9PSEU|nr:hypothetical protein [Lentzea albidocapillata]SDL99595.1 hypothetical protein SAMN04488074_11598 [Lentzea albidocapillata subsp. violacea]
MKIFRHLNASLLIFCAMVAAGAFVFVLVVTFAVSAFRGIEISGWNVVTSQIARWFLFWMGIYVIHNMLPIAVAHGRTRREFLAGASAFTVVLALLMAVLGWLGFAAEGGIYSLMDWNADEHGSPVAYFLMFLVWCTTGMFCAAAFDRFGAGGIFSVPIGVVLVAVTTVDIPGSGNLPFIPNLPVLLGAGWHAVSVAAFLVALACTWAIARDMPVRLRTT